MCRLYGFLSNEPRTVECELIRAQNGLMAQSLRDEQGKSNPHGWGIGAYLNGTPSVKRWPKAAFRSDAFRWSIPHVFARIVIAHVRRATVGAPSHENTHPFNWGSWLLAHNGTLGAFSSIQPRMVAAMTPTYRPCLRGESDSEHLFHLLLSLREQHPDASLLDVLRRGVLDVIEWSQQAASNAERTMNILWTNGEDMVGSRLGRSLWMVECNADQPCEVCGGVLHVGEATSNAYRAVVVASERLTASERWIEIPEGSLFHIDRHVGWHLEAL